MGKVIRNDVILLEERSDIETKSLIQDYYLKEQDVAKPIRARFLK